MGWQEGREGDHMSGAKWGGGAASRDWACLAWPGILVTTIRSDDQKIEEKRPYLP